MAVQTLSSALRWKFGSDRRRRDLMTERRFRHDPDEMWWLPEARCIGEDPELFFPIGTSDDALSQVADAKTVCRGCSVRADCLEWSLSTFQDAGVWGGLDEEE